MPSVIPDSQGLLAELEIDPPVAGAPITYRPPPMHRHLLLSFAFYFITDVNVADRRCWLSVDFSGHMHQISSSAVTQPASTTYLYIFSTVPEAKDLTMAFLLASHVITTPIGDNYFLTPRMDLNVNIDNLQAGDAFSTIFLHSQLWIGN